MAKGTKTWKLGEWAVGGIISVEITGKIVKIINKEWDSSTGFKKSSSQKNAKVLSTATIEASEYEAYKKIADYLFQLTTSYYSDVIIKWIESKVEINKGGTFW
jgi:hypothetical protein